MLSVLLIWSVTYTAKCQSQGPNNPGTVTVSGLACLACPGQNWINPANVELADGIFSTASLTAHPACFQTACYRTRAMLATNFGFSIPTNATISYITVDIKRMGSTASVITDSLVSLLYSSVTVGTNHASASYWPTSNTDTVYGGPGDLWGYAWTPAEINSSTFGVALIAKNTFPAAETASVDNINVTIYYTLPVSGRPVAAFIAGDTAICRGDTVRFIDLSTGSPTSWSWSFPGGTPDTSTQQDPSVVYSADGWHTVSLIATNSNGSDTLTLVNYIHENSLISSLSIHAPAYCAGDTGQMTAVVTGSAASWQWSPCTGLSACAAAVTEVYADTIMLYTLTVTDPNGCRYTQSVMDTANPLPTVPAITVSGDTLVSSSTYGNQRYQNGMLLAGDTLRRLAAIAMDTYTVAVTNTDGCTAPSAPTVFNFTGMMAVTTGKGMTIYPNPTTGEFFVHIEPQQGSDITLHIFDQLGRTVVSRIITGDSMIDASQLPQGVYTVRCEVSGLRFSPTLMILR